MIRLILTAFALILFFILFSPALLILYLVHLKNPLAAHKVSQPIVKYAFRFVTWFTGSKTIRLGMDKVPKDRAVMFASNHRGFLDASLTYGSMPVVCSNVAKKEIKKVPFLSWWMINLENFFLDRDDPRSGIKMVLESIDNINKGVSVFIAPEGTRSKTRDMNPFKEGCFKIATKTGCPIVPVAISGTDEVLENQFPRIKPATIVIEYGDPIYPETLTAEEQKFIGAYTQKKVAQMLEGHEKLIYNNPSRKRERGEIK